MNLDRQPVLVTGAARRIGAAIARRLHTAGAQVIIHYGSSAAPAQALADELNAARAGSAALVQADLADDAALAPLVESAANIFGGLAGLVNNASTYFATPVGGITPKDWDALMTSNLKAPLFLCQAAAPHLASAGGSIVNIIDINARTPLREHTVYCVAKAGLAMLTRSLAVELGPRVRVNGVAPGPILWPEPEPDEETKRDVIANTQLGRIGQPDDVAGAVCYLMGDAPFVTGHILPVDGGTGLRPRIG